MTQEGNILIDPFFVAFSSLTDKLHDIHLDTPDRDQKFWIRYDTHHDKLVFWSPATNFGTVSIHRREFEGSQCLYVIGQPEQNGTISEAKIEIYALSWKELAEQLQPLASRYFQEPFLNLMRQLGGDSEHAGRYVALHAGGDND